MPFKDWDDGRNMFHPDPVLRAHVARLRVRWLKRRGPVAAASGSESHSPDRSDVEVIPRDTNANGGDGDAMLHKVDATTFRMVAYFANEIDAQYAILAARERGAYAVALFPLDDHGHPVGPNG